MQQPFRYFMIHKPYGMESQFKRNYPGDLLSDLDFPFPEGTHAVGRLDKPSEGLLLLTTNKKITKLLFQGKVPHKRTYLVQVKGTVSEEKLHELGTGVSIRTTGEEFYRTPACEVAIAQAPSFPPPIPFPSAYVPTTWLTITLTEGKYRQVRKMVSAIGHRCVRLIRVSIEDLELGTLPPGQVQELEEVEFFSKLKL